VAESLVIDVIQTLRVDTPPRYGLIATRSSGRLRVGARTVYSQYSYYAVNTAAGGALIELSGEVAELTDNLYRALLASIDRAPTLPSSQNTGQKRPPYVQNMCHCRRPEIAVVPGRNWRRLAVPLVESAVASA
jgi:hypothetical protein